MKTDGAEERDNDTGKRKWSTPKLRVFVRSRMGEGVLLVCRTANQGGWGTHYGGCYQTGCQVRCSAFS